MLRPIVFLLFGTAVFAQYYEERKHPSAFPIDFNDDIYNKDMRGPPTDRLVFNFEQRRIDQPPQYEVRDENLRQYMGRPKTTTPEPITTTRYPELPAQRPNDNRNYMHRQPDMRAPASPAAPMASDPKKWGPMASHLPATLPPPPDMPKWMDLSDDSLKYQSHQTPSRHRSEYYGPSAPTQHQWDHHSTQHYQPQPSTNMYQTAEPVRESQKPRGSHKFAWSDVKAPEPVFSPTTVASVPMQNRNPPPSFPTLSPWHDGFGK